MSAKHRKASKLAAKRTAIAATAIGATASISLMGAPAQAADTPPNYSQIISDYSNALDNLLNASNNVNNGVGSVWNPLASQTGGLLPVFSSDFDKVDGTDIRNLPKILTTIANLTLPGNVPAATPEIIVAGQTIGIDLPTEVPGKDLILGAAGLAQAGINVFDSIEVGGGKTALDLLPPLSTLVDGLEFTQSNYTSQYDWSLLGMNGATHVVNTFLKTPDGIKTNPFTIPIGIPGIPISADIPVGGYTLIGPDVIPYGTIWVPQADGTYNFPLQSKIGWWAAMPTAAVKLPTSLGGSQTVIAAPIYAGGVDLPFKLLSVGGLGANVLLPTSNGVYSPISLNMTNIQSVLPFGLTNLNVTTGNYAGTNGFYFDNGQNLALLNNPIFPIPLIYGLGGLNFGVEGAGIQSPSLFGIKLFSDIQLGDPVGPNNPAGLIPVNLLPDNPMNTILTAVTGAAGISSLTDILGLDSLVLDPLTGLLTPVYQGFSSVALKPISDFATSQYGPFLNNSASQLLSLSKTLSERTADLPGAPTQPELLTADDDASPATTLTTSSKQKPEETTGSHRIEDGGEPASQMLTRLTGNDTGNNTNPGGGGDNDGNQQGGGQNDNGGAPGNTGGNSGGTTDGEGAGTPGGDKGNGTVESNTDADKPTGGDAAEAPEVSDDNKVVTQSDENPSTDNSTVESDESDKAA